ncbi:MAG TPA: hypothetical protein VHY79_05695 [Rhizomicrobium sp.]|jgi:hypothetical protein|nr:hypothetical protein [Rhizomicrobium sp.]
MFRVFPVLLIVVAVYSVIALAHGLVSNDAMEAFLTNERVTFHMFSGDTWHFSLGDLLVTLGFVCLFIEIVKSTRTTSRALVNHGLSVLVFVIAIVEFIVVRGFSTSVFFFIMVMTAFDVIAGYTISVVAAEHDLGVGRAGTDPR